MQSFKSILYSRFILENFNEHNQLYPKRWCGEVKEQIWKFHEENEGSWRTVSQSVVKQLFYLGRWKEEAEKPSVSDIFLYITDMQQGDRNAWQNISKLGYIQTL